METGLENWLTVLKHSYCCPISHFSKRLPSHFCGSYPKPLFSSILPSVAVLLLSVKFITSVSQPTSINALCSPATAGYCGDLPTLVWPFVFLGVYSWLFLFFSCLFSHFHVLTLLHVRHFTGSLVLPQEGFTPGLCPAVPTWARCAVDSSYLPRTSLHHPMFLGPYVFLFSEFPSCFSWSTSPTNSLRKEQWSIFLSPRMLANLFKLHWPVPEFHVENSFPSEFWSRCSFVVSGVQCAFEKSDATLLQASLEPQRLEIALWMSCVVLGTCPVEGWFFCSRRFSGIISLVIFFFSVVSFWNSRKTDVGPIFSSESHHFHQRPHPSLFVFLSMRLPWPCFPTLLLMF